MIYLTLTPLQMNKKNSANMCVIFTVQAENDKMLKICTDKASNYHQICLYLSLTNRHTYTLFSVARRLSQTITEQYKININCKVTYGRNTSKEHIRHTRSKPNKQTKNAPKCTDGTDTGKRHGLH